MGVMNIEADWTLVGTADDSDSTATITGVKRTEVDEQVAMLVNAGWDVHVYEPVLKHTIPGKPQPSYSSHFPMQDDASPNLTPRGRNAGYCECHGIFEDCGYQDVCR